MKCSTLVVLAGAVILGGCASTDSSAARDTAKSSSSVTPLGTAIARKSPNPADPVVVVDMQALENARLMSRVR